LAHILALNRRGYAFREELSSILLSKMFSPSGTGYIDLQSPAGIGIGALVYNYDGSVYASDEGRMLAEMGDQSFRLAHLDDTELSFAELITSEALVSLLDETLLESAPMCSDCPYLPLCGADPAFHKATLNDVLGHKRKSAFCTRQMGVLHHLITLLEDDPDAREILRGWV
jgi:radical SAM protein with 4Fe4S-binding SPASM domain